MIASLFDCVMVLVITLVGIAIAVAASLLYAKILRNKELAEIAASEAAERKRKADELSRTV